MFKKFNIYMNFGIQKEIKSIPTLTSYFKDKTKLVQSIVFGYVGKHKFIE